MNGIFKPVKITTVGDGMVGKTCMLITYTLRKFPTDYIPTIFDNYTENITVDGINYKMTLWDTAGQEDYDRLRPLSYPNTDCFLLCYSIDNRASYENVALKWSLELKKFSPETPILLVGTKIDLRKNSDKKLLSYNEGKRLMKEINASSFVECSAVSLEGLGEVFQEAIRLIQNKNRARPKNCTIL